jgi:plastocyanin
MRRLTAATMGLLAAAAVLTGCGSKSSGSASGNATTLTAANISFSPTDIQLKSGKAEITVKNTDGVKHNLTIADLKVNKDLAPGATAKATFTAKPGTYQFHCEYHPSQMKGTVTVGS